MILSDKPGPIAVFDSGYGGLTILEKIRNELPEYDLVYLGDNARNPYGTRSFDVVYDYTQQAVKTLFEKGAHLVILACNTASAKALRNIQQKNLPLIDPARRVLGVVRPSVESVARYSHNGHIGVMGTVGTIQSESYNIEINKLYPQMKVTGQACPMWVPLVENEESFGEGADYFVKKYVDALFKKDDQIDTIILGCTHYPILTPKIKKYIPQGVTIIEQGDIVAHSLKDYLQRHPEMETKCTKTGSTTYFTTEHPEKFKRNAEVFLNRHIDVKHIVLS